MFKIVTFSVAVLAMFFVGCTRWAAPTAVVKASEAHIMIEPVQPAVDSQLAEIGDFLSDPANQKLFKPYRVNHDSGAIVVDFVQNKQKYTVFYSGHDARPVITFFVKPIGSREKSDMVSSELSGLMIRGISGKGSPKDTDKTTEENMQFMEKTDLQAGVGEMYRGVWRGCLNRSVEDTLQFIHSHQQ